ncbi:hypothetical protein MTR67_035270 [Solanum verrucosum]|uniref:Uncharacterized protein n=1 Tax=Solanum verrucosum TaxID=315347 RepID=A0AAF0ZLD6_SOLVR|nr:hypothetical protein MTR67_035270 [Solanum verrucosum]
MVRSAWPSFATGSWNLESDLRPWTTDRGLTYESSLVIEVKAKQDDDPTLVELKVAFLKKTKEVFPTRRDDVLCYQNHLCVLNVEKGEPQRGSRAVNRTTVRLPHRGSHPTSYGGPQSPSRVVVPLTGHSYLCGSEPSDLSPSEEPWWPSRSMVIHTGRGKARGWPFLKSVATASRPRPSRWVVVLVLDRHWRCGQPRQILS